MLADFVGSHACAVVLQRFSAGFWAFIAIFQVKLNSDFMQALNNQVKDTINKKEEPAADERKINLMNGAAIAIKLKNEQEIVETVQAAPGHKFDFKNCLLLSDDLCTYRGRNIGRAIFV